MEKKKYTEEELTQLHKEVEAELKKIPGVVAVGFGYKERNNRLTTEVAFRVYVLSKKDKAAIPADQLIPGEIRGFKTDVLEREVTKQQSDEYVNQRYRPVVGGIAISVSYKNSAAMANTSPMAAGSPFTNKGTLGCIAQVKKTKQIVLLSNYHVLHAHANTGGFVYQPKFDDDEANPYTHVSRDFELVATVLDAGMYHDHHRYTYPGETEAKDYYIDCEIARLNIIEAKTCETKVGITYKPLINNLQVNECDHIVNVGRIKRTDIVAGEEYLVYKVGATTGRTTGRVADPFYTAPHQIEPPSAENPLGDLMETMNVIKIVSTTESNGFLDRFSHQGDSGSVIINSKNEIVGLHFAAADPLFDNYDKILGIEEQLRAEGKTENEIEVAIDLKKKKWASCRSSSACHIQPVLDYLQIVIVHKPCKTSAEARSSNDTDLTIDYELNSKLSQLIISSSGQLDVYKIFSEFNEEFMNLLNSCRPVTVTWHRNKGPAFVAHFVRKIHDPAYQVPLNINGTTIPMLFAAMKPVLMEHASEGMKNAIKQYGDQIIENATDVADLQTLLQRVGNIQTPVRQ